MFPLILHAAAGAIFLKHGEQISLCLKTHHWTTINLGIKLSLLPGPFWSGLPLSQPHHHHSALFLVHQEHRVLCHRRTLHVLCPPYILNLSPVPLHWIILNLYSGLQLKRHFFWEVFPDYSSPCFSSTKCDESLSSVLPEHPLQILLCLLLLTVSSPRLQPPWGPGLFWLRLYPQGPNFKYCKKMP